MKEDLLAQVTIKLEKADYDARVTSVLKDHAKKANMPGFRPGKVPFGLIKKQYFRFPQQLHRQSQPALLPTTEPLWSLSVVQPMQSDLAENLDLLAARQPAVTQVQFLAHAQTQEVAFRKLEDDTTKPASLALIQACPLPGDGAGLGAGHAADDLQQAGFAAAACP